jgi:hypothetical protein
MDLREIEWDGVDWIDRAQDRDEWSSLLCSKKLTLSPCYDFNELNPHPPILFLQDTFPYLTSIFANKALHAFLIVHVC